MIRMTIYAGPGPDDGGLYKPSVSSRLIDERELSEELRKLGLEWKQADYFSQRQTVITLDPMPAAGEIDVQARIREAATALEGTGLL